MNDLLILYNILWFFLIYSFGGWIIEVAFHAVRMGRIVNRGFLAGPLCPVYGFGILFVLGLLEVIRRLFGYDLSSGGIAQMILLFLFGMLIASFTEFLAGLLLNVFFSVRLWDYSEKPLNLKGYICLGFSALWGTGILFIIRLVHPALEAAVVRILPLTVGIPLLAVLVTVFAVDSVLTVLTMIGLDRKLEEIDSLQATIRSVSDKMTVNIASTSIKTAQNLERGKLQVHLAGMELKQKKEAAEARSRALAASLLSGGKSIFTRSSFKRLLNAFPQMTLPRHSDAFAYVKSLLRNNKRRD